MTEHSDHEQDAAAYVLGALDPGEAAVFARHLESCVVCRDEVAAFRQTVDALPMSAPQYRAPAGLRTRVMRGVRAEPRAPVVAPAQPGGRRPRMVARPAFTVGLAAATVVAVVAVVAVVIAVTAGSSTSGTRVFRASVGDAIVRVSGGHGELIVARLPAPAAGHIYEMWLQRGSGAPSPSTLFGVTSQGTAVVGVPGDLNGVRIVMVSSEPLGGSRAPTSRPVVVANLT
jgi:anti-sigma factor RsiW